MERSYFGILFKGPCRILSEYVWYMSKSGYVHLTCLLPRHHRANTAIYTIIVLVVVVNIALFYMFKIPVQS